MPMCLRYILYLCILLSNYYYSLMQGCKADAGCTHAGCLVYIKIDAVVDDVRAENISHP
jgi:hypothetical protein